MVLVVEEAVALVDDVPQRLEVALRRVVVLLLLDAGGEGEKEAKDAKEVKEMGR